MEENNLIGLLTASLSINWYRIYRKCMGRLGREDRRGAEATNDKTYSNGAEVF